MRTFWQNLSSPEYQHALISLLPISGLAAGVLGLCLAIYFRARMARLAALILITGGAALVWPVCYYFGWHDVQIAWDQNQNTWSSQQVRPGEAFASLFVVVTILAVLSIIIELRASPAAVPLAMATLFPAITAVGLGVYMIFTDCPITPHDSHAQTVAPTGPTDHQREARNINDAYPIR